MNEILEKQRTFFRNGETLSIKTRLGYLKKLRVVIKTKEKQIAEALHRDLGKSHTEAYMCEIGLSISEISYYLKNLKKFAKDKIAPTQITNFH